MMSGNALPRCLQLCICMMVVFRLKGEVMAPSNLQAVTGLPYTLACNLTNGIPETVKQVRWLDGRSQTLIAYLPGQPARVLSKLDHVELSTSRWSSSAVTIKKVVLEDEGCYKCIFDTYPDGAQKAETCLTVTAKVVLEGNKTAVSGKLASLSCWYGLPERVQQVLWRKIADQGDTTTVASYSKHGRPTIERPFQNRMALSQSLGDTQLSIFSVKSEDDGCYTCEFHTYPDGTRSATSCLSVYVLPKPAGSYVTISPGVIEANCTAQSRPAVDIVWNVEGHNQTLGPSNISSFEHGDGTTLVTSTLLFQARLLNDMSIKCLVHHQGLESPISVSMNIKIGRALTILIAVSCVATFILVCLCICLCKCFQARDGY